MKDNAIYVFRRWTEFVKRSRGEVGVEQCMPTPFETAKQALVWVTLLERRKVMLVPEGKHNAWEIQYIPQE
jgi:hypothetical protein